METLLRTKETPAEMLLVHYKEVRSFTGRIVEPLEIEGYVIRA